MERVGAGRGWRPSFPRTAPLTVVSMWAWGHTSCPQEFVFDAVMTFKVGRKGPSHSSDANTCTVLLTSLPWSCVTCI